MNLEDAQTILDIKNKVDIMWQYFTEEQDKTENVNVSDIKND